MNALRFLEFMACAGLMAAGGVFLMYDDSVGLAVILIFCGGLGVLWAVADSMWTSHNDELDNRTFLVRARTNFAIAVSSTDKETRHFLAQEWPELGVEFGVDPIFYLLEDGVNTHVILAFLRKFLEDSNKHEFVDLRNFNDDKYLQQRFDVSREVVRRQWTLATEFLARKGFLVPDSMRGSRTWQWTTEGHYKLMVRQYLNIREVKEMADV